MADDKFWVPSEVADNFNMVNHNDTDYEAFKDFQKGLDERFAAIESKRRKAERIANLEKWDDSLTGRWKEARLGLIKKPVVAKITKALDEDPSGSFFLTGESGAGKSFVAYAVIRRMIGHGEASPSQVKTISESVLANWASRGYQGQDLLSELFDPRYKLYLFDGIGTLSDHEVERVASLWEQIITHVYTHSLTAVFTSVDKLDKFVTEFSPSGETKLRTLVDGRIFNVESDGSVASKKKQR